MSPIDTIVACDDCGRRLNEADQDEEYFFVTWIIETSGTAKKRNRTKRTFTVLCGFCLKKHPDLLRLLEAKDGS